MSEGLTLVPRSYLAPLSPLFERHTMGLCPTPRCFNRSALPLSTRGTKEWYRFLRYNFLTAVYFNAPADKKPSRVPRYQKGRRMSGFCHSSVKPFPMIGKGFGIRFEAFLTTRKVGWLGKSFLRRKVLGQAKRAELERVGR